jgi:hypothetical protein
MKRLFVAVLIALLALIPAACRKSREQAAEEMAEKIIASQSGGKAEVDLSGGKVKITSTEKGKEGTFEFSGGKDMKLSSDFPGDVPLYPGSKILAQMKMGAGNQQVTLQADDPTKDVYDYYTKQMAKNGWEIVQEMKMPPTFTLVGKKGKRQAAVVIGDDGNKSTISVSLTEEQG